jgi:hypothetical protein
MFLECVLNVPWMLNDDIFKMEVLAMKVRPLNEFSSVRRVDSPNKREYSPIQRFVLPIRSEFSPT